MAQPARTPDPPYYAVIFTSLRTNREEAEYAAAADRMLELAAQQPGYLGVESVRDSQGLGITVSYWQDLRSISAWRDQAEHQVIQQQGKEKWYAQYHLRICHVEKDTQFPR